MRRAGFGIGAILLALVLGAFSGTASAQTAQEIFRSSEGVLFDRDESGGKPGPSPPASKPPAKKVAEPKDAAATELAARTDPRKQPAERLGGASGRLAMRYRVEKDFGSGDWRAVDPDTVFRSGDRIRLAVEANADAFLYVVNEGSSGRGQLLYPYRNADPTAQRVNPFETYIVPNPAVGYFRFDDQPGDEKLFVVLSRAREAALDRFLPEPRRESAPTPSAPKRNEAEWRLARSNDGVEPAVLSQLRSDLGASRDLVMERVQEPLAQDAGAVAQTVSYIASQDTSDDARVIVEITLSHR